MVTASTPATRIPNDWSDPNVLNSMTPIEDIDMSRLMAVNALVTLQSDDLGKPTRITSCTRYKVAVTAAGIYHEEHFVALFVVGKGGPETLPMIDINVTPLLKKLLGDVAVRWFQSTVGPSTSVPPPPPSPVDVDMDGT
ncbi:hypothetical protein E6O75_ATG08525 [Venturia nashicola]|uniref:Uncharacterized protein n=1 Tax=Venturia nashicola TaxID=86259 RepID=A0A4Z1NVH4_9PEZI|nr:hypothetical protein E6O75_ATG08525 [Venturia nashicola]